MRVRQEAPDAPGKRPLEPLVQDAGSTASAGDPLNKKRRRAPLFIWCNSSLISRHPHLVTCISSLLLKFNSPGLHDLAPFRQFGADVRGELIGPAAHGVRTVGRESVLNFRQYQDAGDLSLQLADDVA